MSVDEFYRWAGYLRQNPTGPRWLAKQFGELKREIAKARVQPGKKVPDLDHFVAKRPEPLFSIRMKREAQKRDKT